MGRGKDLGRDFDRQFDQSQRRAQPKRDRGEGPWNMDKRLADNNNRGGGGSKDGDSCLIAAVALLSTFLVSAYGAFEYLI
jgi:hypothetical protein